MDDKVKQWRPREVIIHDSVKDDPIAHHFLDQCPGTPVKYVTGGNPKDIIRASEVLTQLKGNLLDKILLGALQHTKDTHMGKTAGRSITQNEGYFG